MAKEYLKCIHGVSLQGLILCKECEESKNQSLIIGPSGIGKSKFADFIAKDTRKPIYKGCPNAGGACFCPGTCKEIIGYED